MQKEDLLALISECFEGKTPPDHDHIICEDCNAIYEALEIKGVFQNHTWQEIGNEVLIDNKAALGYFSDQAFIYFLPAYMRLMVIDIESADVLRESLLKLLTLPTQADAEEEYRHYNEDVRQIAGLDLYYQDQILNIDQRIQEFKRRVAQLSNAESRCIRLFLEYLQANHGDYFQDLVLAKSIQRHWFQFK